MIYKTRPRIVAASREDTRVLRNDCNADGRAHRDRPIRVRDPGVQADAGAIGVFDRHLRIDLGGGDVEQCGRWPSMKISHPSSGKRHVGLRIRCGGRAVAEILAEDLR